MENFVVESSIISRKEIVGFAGRKYAEIEIDNIFDFEPGQYLMICTENREVEWPYPYFLQRKTECKVTVLAEEHQDLYQSQSGDRIRFWGPRGTSPLQPGRVPVLVADPAVGFILAPFLKEGQYQKLCVIGKESPSPMLTGINVLYCDDIQTVAEKVSEENSQIIAALNPDNAEAFSECVKKERKEDIFLYISNKKACGLDGCKGCYLHDQNGGFGINVCCKGPFLPLSSVDFERDRGCLEQFV